MLGIIRLILMLLLPGLLMSGCTLSPSISIVGSYFPSWLFCIVAGVILTVMVRSTLVRMQRERVLGPPIIVYSALTVLFSLVVWLIFFHH